MPSNNPQIRAKAAIQKARDKAFKWKEIALATGVTMGTLSNIHGAGINFSDDVAHKIIDGCRKLRRAP